MPGARTMTTRKEITFYPFPSAQDPAMVVGYKIGNHSFAWDEATFPIRQLILKLIPEEFFSAD
jgi:hypothetical protein